MRRASVALAFTGLALFPLAPTAALASPPAANLAAGSYLSEWPSLFQEELPDGALAPVGRWYVAGGCAARTGLSQNPAVRHDPEPAWTLRVRGEIESEPLVWDGRVVVSARESKLRRTLHVVDLDSGEPLASVTLAADRPLNPALWNEWIAVHPEEERVELYRLSGRQLRLHRSFAAERGKPSVSDPLLFENVLYLRSGDALVAYPLDRNEALWRFEPDGVVRGAPSIRGDYVYVVHYDRSGYAHLSAIDRGRGRVVDETVAGHHNGKRPSPSAELEIVLVSSQAILAMPLPLESIDGGVFDTVRLSMKPDGTFRESPLALHRFSSQPSAFGEGWIVLDDSVPSGSRWISSEESAEGVRSIVLADRQRHAYLLQDAAATSFARSVCYLQGLAVDAESLGILWRVERRPRMRPVPAEEKLLIVPARSELIALREPSPASTPEEREAQRLGDVLDQKQAEGFAALALSGLRAGDLGLVRRLLAEAEERGAPERTLESVRSGLERWEKASRPPTPDPRRIESLLAEEHNLLATPLVELVRSAEETGDEGLRRELLRIVLEREPDHSGARRLVRELIPDATLREISPPEVSSISWLDYLDVHATTEVRFLPRPLPGDDQPKRSPDEEVLAAEGESWRADVGGFKSDRLLVVTPPGSPGSVARALAVGELVCNILEDLFAPLGTRTTSASAKPLTLLLYEDEEEYLSQSQRGGSRPEIAHGWSAGHYSPAEGLSRMYIPEDDEDSRRLLAVYAHELTHHWLDERAPFPSKGRGADGRHGYWITEGFATLVEEFTLNPERGTWSARNRRASSLDTLANAQPAQLIPWSRFFELDHSQATSLSTQSTKEVPLSWRLGMHTKKSDLQFFYAQAGAVCHYLYEADKGKHRAVLLEIVRSWYEDGRPTDFEKAIGMGPEKLGKRVVEYAREAVR